MTAESLAAEVFRYLPAAERARLQHLARLAELSVEGAIAMSLAAEAITKYAPVEERAKVAGMLMVTYSREPKP